MAPGAPRLTPRAAASSATWPVARRPRSGSVRPPDVGHVDDRAVGVAVGIEGDADVAAERVAGAVADRAHPGGRQLRRPRAPPAPSGRRPRPAPGSVASSTAKTPRGQCARGPAHPQPTWAPLLAVRPARRSAPRARSPRARRRGRGPRVEAGARPPRRCREQPMTSTARRADWRGGASRHRVAAVPPPRRRVTDVTTGGPPAAIAVAMRHLPRGSSAEPARSDGVETGTVPEMNGVVAAGGAGRLSPRWPDRGRAPVASPRAGRGAATRRPSRARRPPAPPPLRDQRRSSGPGSVAAGAGGRGGRRSAGRARSTSPSIV